MTMSMGFKVCEDPKNIFQSYRQGDVGKSGGCSLIKYAQIEPKTKVL